MALPIRDPLLDHERDTYLSRRQPVSPEDALEAGGFSPLEPIDCLLGCGQWGVSPLARAALAAFDPGALAHYPERFHETLLAPAILGRFAGHGVTAEQLFLGHGSFNILERIVHKLVRPGCMLGIGPAVRRDPLRVEGGGRQLPAAAARGPGLLVAARRARERRRARGRLTRLRRQPQQPARAPLPAGRAGASGDDLCPAFHDPGGGRGARRLRRRRASPASGSRPRTTT